MKPILVDGFSKAGGAARGYQRAGFHVIGIDIEPQPNYVGEEFVQGDFFEVLPQLLAEHDVRAIHGSPPCQAFTVYGNNRAHVRNDHPDLIDSTRQALIASGLPWIIENVPGAPLIDPVRLCGTSFPPLEVRRHRIFESNVKLTAPPCDHGRLTERKYPGSTNRPNGRTVCNIGEYRVPLALQKVAIGIDWMTLAEISQAIPPAYTEHLGRQLMEAI